MIERRNLEVLSGSLALGMGMLGSHMIASSSAANLVVFGALSVILILTAAAVLVSRLQETDQKVKALLLKQLPAELAQNLPTEKQFGVEDLIQNLGDHAEAQRQLLNQSFNDLLRGQVAMTPSISEAHDTLNLLRAELAALEDLYATDIDRDNSSDPISGYFKG